LNALARHYSNRSVELLSQGDLKAAVQSGELATRIDPMLADAWINLGVARRRADDWAGAEEAYLQASAVSPDNMSAYQNLRVLFTLRGDQDAADQLLVLMDRRGCRDPFVYLELGDESLAADSAEEAGRYYRRAYKHGPELAETRAARGIGYLKQGELGKARKWLRRAQSIDVDEKRTRELERRLRQMAGCKDQERNPSPED
jgi:Flp pilus assembly protein TadD